LAWTWDPDPADETYDVAYAFLLREADGTVNVDFDRHREGLFSRDDWLAWLREAGFSPRMHTDRWNRELFVGIRDE
ncbi:MAG TPA: hypothetical protein VFX98_04820, partial [Longimicrobiaceae bacterium]|nr:hypothetical protein [Longimicrobiaceae bacterium]